MPIVTTCVFLLSTMFTPPAVYISGKWSNHIKKGYSSKKFKNDASLTITTAYINLKKKLIQHFGQGHIFISYFWKCIHCYLYIYPQCVYLHFDIINTSLCRPALHYTLEFAVSLQRFRDLTRCLKWKQGDEDVTGVKGCSVAMSLLILTLFTVPVADVPSQPAWPFGKDLSGNRVIF